MTTPCTDTMLVDGEDVQQTAYIIDASGLLADAPQRADLIQFDWVDGETYIDGPKAAYSFDVPVLMRSRDPAMAILQLRHLQSWVGGEKTITRRFVVGVGQTSTQTCRGVIVDAVQVQWNLDDRYRMRAVLVVRNLDGRWVGT